MGMWWRYQFARRTRLALPAIAIAACASGDAEHGAATAVQQALVGSWIRVYPSVGAPDTITLYADGRVTGSTTGIDRETPVPLAQWRLGDPLMPNGLCIGTERARHCQGFRLSGDTLGLANQKRAVFVRASAMRPGARPATLLSPPAQVDAPRPLEPVKLNAPTRD